MARHGWKWLELLGIAEKYANDYKLLEMSRNGRNGRKWQEWPEGSGNDEMPKC